MQIMPLQINNPNKKAKNIQFAGGYDRAVESLAKNYYAKFFTSEFANKLSSLKAIETTDMTKHMAAAGSALISGMYVVRTLQNDKLDKKKRKTLAINDALTWGLSTVGAYALDDWLNAKWSQLSDKWVKGYLTRNPQDKNVALLGEWDTKDLKKIIEEAPQKALNTYEEKKQLLGEDSKEFNKWLKEVKFNKKHFKELKEFVDGGGKLKNVSELNLNILRNQKLDTCIKGFSALKTVFVFCMVYRYIVPVLIMKPANKIGAYIHKKNDEKQARLNAQTLNKTA